MEGVMRSLGKDAPNVQILAGCVADLCSRGRVVAQVSEGCWQLLVKQRTVVWREKALQIACVPRYLAMKPMKRVVVLGCRSSESVSCRQCSLDTER
jgi:hypothetical protein